MTNSNFLFIVKIIKSKVVKTLYTILTAKSHNNIITHKEEKNNAYGKDIANVLRKANDVINLNKIISNLKEEIEELK